MTVDLSEEFEGITSLDTLDFDNESERREYVREKMLQAARLVPFRIVAWVEKHYPGVLLPTHEEELLTATLAEALVTSVVTQVRGQQLRLEMMDRLVPSDQAAGME